MELIKCPDCGKEISRRAVNCPNCGCPAQFFESSEERINNENKNPGDELFSIFKKAGIKVTKAEPFEYEMKALRDIFSYYINDWRDLMGVNKAISDDLKNKIGGDHSVTLVTNDNLDTCINNMGQDKFEYPYIVVHANLTFDVGVYTKYQILNNDGSIAVRYYDDKQLPGRYIPVFSVFSNNKKQVEELSTRIVREYANHVLMNAPCYSNKENVCFSCSTEDNFIIYDHISNYSDRVFYESIIAGKTTIWPTSIEIDEHSINNASKSMFRMIQIAQVYSLICTWMPDINQEMILYDRLFYQVGFLKNAFGPVQSNDYTQLKDLITSGSHNYNIELVEKAFPKISFIYHDLINDIYRKTPANILKNRIHEIISSYHLIKEKICQTYNIPDNIGVKYFGYSSHNCNMCSNEGLTYIITALNNNRDRSISDIVSEYRAMVEAEVEAKLSQIEEESNSVVIRENTGSFNSSFLGSLAGTYLGNKAANKKRDNNKYGDYKGTAGCNLSHSRNTGCNYSCNLYNSCIWGKGHK
ncbi:MAG: zinc ribbon domain-containing protein [Clostridia bacterium]|nr:zinc ribbon domain-containing protein [Clostridia bacterium]